MNIELWMIEKTDKALKPLEDEYVKRISGFLKLKIKIIPSVTEKNPEIKKLKEWAKLSSEILPNDGIILLDETGQSKTSRAFSMDIEQKMVASIYKRLIFIIGGPFGFSKEAYLRANEKISLSKMTFSHQLIRIIFLEQLYRAFTIINNHPYHND